MYRTDAQPNAEATLFTQTVGISTAILVLLGVGPLLLILFAWSLGNGKMAVSVTPLLVAFAICLALRQRIRVSNKAVYVTRAFLTRTLPYEGVNRVVLPHAFNAMLAATSASKGAAAVLLYNARGVAFLIPNNTPGDVLDLVVRTALGPAVKRARDLIATGGRYMDPDAFSGVDAQSLHGSHIGLTRSARVLPLSDVARIDSVGNVLPRSESTKERFMIGIRDLVLCALLREKGVSVDLPSDVARFVEQQESAQLP